MIDCKDCRHCDELVVVTPTRSWFSMPLCKRHSDPSYVQPEGGEVRAYDVAFADPSVSPDEFLAAYAQSPTGPAVQYATSCNAERHGPSTDRHCGEDARFFEPIQQETT